MEGGRQFVALSALGPRPCLRDCVRKRGDVGGGEGGGFQNPFRSPERVLQSTQSLLSINVFLNYCWKVSQKMIYKMS